MTSGAKKGCGNNCGTALVLVIGVLAIVTISVSSFLALLHASINYTRREEAHAWCVHVAEAGLEKAVAELRAGRAAYTRESDTPVGVGEFSIGVSGVNGRYTITSRGRIARGGLTTVRTLQAEVRIEGRRVVEFKWREIDP
ncbi:MAG TPA: hypothetical protein VMZ06_16990 [Candidatus Bathyarchaeia archaeon]|nr:hypothetical protein [Candidatus Bathyarchaeia archaeon]